MMRVRIDVIDSGSEEENNAPVQATQNILEANGLLPATHPDPKQEIVVENSFVDFLEVLWVPTFTLNVLLTILDKVLVECTLSWSCRFMDV